MTSATVLLLIISIILIGILQYRKFSLSKIKSTKIPTTKIHAALLGVAIGDAVGVPYEFSSRAQMKSKPATDMTEFGTHDQPKGTWSDDSSLTFCLAEALVHEYSLKEISSNFIKWKNEGYWSARGEVFDIGFTTKTAINRLEQLINSNQIEDLKIKNIMEMNLKMRMDP